MFVECSGVCGEGRVENAVAGWNNYPPLRFSGRESLCAPADNGTSGYRNLPRTPSKHLLQRSIRESGIVKRPRIC